MIATIEEAEVRGEGVEETGVEEDMTILKAKVTGLELKLTGETSYWSLIYPQVLAEA